MQNSKSENKKITYKIIYSWPVILLSIIFPLITPFLIYKRYTYDKAAMQKNYKGLRNVGIFLLWVVIVYIIMDINGGFAVEEGEKEVAIYFTYVVFGSLSLFFFFSAAMVKKNSQKYAKYVNVVVDQRHTSIQKIASVINTSYENAIKDLQTMIEIGIFKDAYIDIYNKEIIISQLKPQNKVSNFETIKTESVQTKTVICKNCGASNIYVIGNVNKCEYCRSHL